MDGKAIAGARGPGAGRSEFATIFIAAHLYVYWAIARFFINSDDGQSIDRSAAANKPSRCRRTGFAGLQAPPP